MARGEAERRVQRGGTGAVGGALSLIAAAYRRRDRPKWPRVRTRTGTDADPSLDGPPARTTIGREYSVSPLELFFDLVFVFALTQVTALLADDLTWPGLLRGLARSWLVSGGRGSATPG